MHEGNQPEGDRRTVLKGLAVGVAGTVASAVGLTEFTRSSVGSSPEPQGYPTLTAGEVDRGFENLDDWDAHVTKTREIGMDVLGYRQAVKEMADRFGSDGEEAFVERVAEKASPFHYDHYRRLANVAADSGKAESERFREQVFHEIQTAEEQSGAVDSVDSTEREVLGVNRDGGRGPGPKQTGNTRLTLEAQEIDENDSVTGQQETFDFEDVVEIFADDDGEIRGINLDSAGKVTTVQASFNGTSGGVGAVSVFAFQEEFDQFECALEQNWIPVASKAVRLPSDEELTFKLVPDQETIEAYRVQVFGQGLKKAVLQNGPIRG